ncbi:hypothetical protein QBC33DRAFT_79684 [Phialemonium atrogriseum]|uniref:Uncharacterized protein n=1 Tax=Phialemonium atrogriseum TaxID=1093897 RepID=A0AAJ0BZG9_9PEZI|nr:uncharacterized protein QBC33DRAFT_79684 [Phialemonium atrogriseum]KAK1767155.1 hypothetical protein QBC33DRAFT_79684 [Phialemonium atrogriseum]
MRIYKLFSLIALLSIAHSIPLRTTDADFLAMRRKLLKDMRGGKASDKKHKYFRRRIKFPSALRWPVSGSRPTWRPRFSDGPVADLRTTSSAMLSKREH